MKQDNTEPEEHADSVRELTAEELAAQAATELPDREAMTLVNTTPDIFYRPGPVYTTMPVDDGVFIPVEGPETM